MMCKYCLQVAVKSTCWQWNQGRSQRINQKSPKSFLSAQKSRLTKERDNGVGRILKWMTFLRIRKCGNSVFAYFREEVDLSPSNADTDWRDLSMIYTDDFNSVSDGFSGANVIEP